MTHSKQVQEVVLEQLADTQRLTPTGSWDWDLRNGAVTWSDELYQIFGVQPLDFDPARDAMSFIHGDDLDGITSAIDAALKARQSYSLVYRIRRRDGSERILHSQGYLVSDEHGELMHVFGTTQDL